MSLDFCWEKLDESLAIRLVEALNRHVAAVTLPSFIGPVEITGFDFGSAYPDVEVVDMRDIYRDFLEDDAGNEDEARRPPDRRSTRPREVSGATTGTVHSQASAVKSFGDDDEYEWVSRQATRRAMAQDAPAYHHLPPHIRYGRSPSADFVTTLPGAHTPRDIWGSSNVRAGYGSGMWSPIGGPLASASEESAARRPKLSALQGVGMGIASGMRPPSIYATSAVSGSSSLANPHSASPIQKNVEGGSPPEAEEANSHPSDNMQPNLQLHLHINYHSDLRLSLSTSLLINYPSPMFMALPIKLSVTGLVFNGEVVVALEGQRKRVHICILDDLDPYGPAADRLNRPCRRDSTGSTPPDVVPEDEEDEDIPGTTPAKPLPIGQRLLPSIFIESELGQADKHVLKNVSRVEKFIQDAIRKTIVDELVFPNFYTLVLDD